MDLSAFAAASEAVADGRPSAAAVFAQQLLGTVNDADLEAIAATQGKTLFAFRRTNQLLGTFNEFSAKRYQGVHKEFEGHVRMLAAMKADLDSIFRRIRVLQAKLAKQYPKAFEEVSRA